MAVSGLVRGIGKGLDELEDAFSGASKVDTPKPKTVLEELEESFSFGKAEDDAPIPLPEVEDIELEEFMAELDQIGKPKVEDPIDEIEAMMAEFDEAVQNPKVPTKEEVLKGEYNVEDDIEAQQALIEKASDKSMSEAQEYSEQNTIFVPPSKLELIEGQTDVDPFLNNYMANFIKNSSEPFPVIAQKLNVIKKIYNEPGMKSNLEALDADPNLTPAAKVDLMNAELDIAYVNSVEEIDLDAMEITPDRPNLPEGRDFDTLIGTAGPDWVYDRDPQDLEALALMTHIRGPYFPHVMDDIVEKNYSDIQVEGFEPFISKAELEAMDPMDVLSINFYTRNGDGPMNEALRDGKYDPNTSLGKAIDATQTALQRLPSYKPRKVEEQVVHRVIRGMEVNQIFGDMKVGDTFVEKAFTSTSLKPSFGVKDGEYDFHLGKEGVFFVIRPKHTGSKAHSIEDLSDFKAAEREVLFEHGTEFKVVGRDHVQSEELMYGGKTVPADAYILYVEEI